MEQRKVGLSGAVGWLKKLGVWFKGASIKKKLIIVLVILVGAWLVKAQFSKGKNEVGYQMGVVERDRVVSLVSETGEIMTAGAVEVVSTIEGVAGEVYVGNGEIIKKGQKLFKVVSTATEEERMKAYADYLKAKDVLEAAKVSEWTLESSMWSAHEIFESRGIDAGLVEDDPVYIETNRDWLAAEKKYIDQKNVVKQAEVALASAWLSYQATIDGVVKSPVAGTVVNLAVAEGQYVDATINSLIVQTGERVWVKLAVNETDVLDLEAGQKAKVSVDALKGEEYEGGVERVDEIGTVESGVVTYNVYIVLNGGGEKIRPGMTVQVDIETERKEDVLVVSNNAIKAYQGGKAVQIMDKASKQVIYLPVEVGIGGLTKTEIISGLEEGQEIIVGQTNLTSEEQRSGGGGVFSVRGR